MKRMARCILRLSAGVAGLVGLLVLVCLDRVDRRPFSGADYYAQTLARHEQQLVDFHLSTGQLAAGFSRVLLTPTLNAAQDDPAHGQFRSLPLAGYGAREGRPATGVHDDLFVKAIAFQVGDQRAVMVSSDALIVPREVADAAAAELARDLRLKRQEIYFGATHTHASLGGWGEGFVAEAFAGDFQPGTRIWWTRQITSAVREAFANLRPATFGHGSFSSAEFVRNRLKGSSGVVNDSFHFFVVQQGGSPPPAGQPEATKSVGALAILGSFGAHATVLPSRFMQFSGDYPGVWQRSLEEALGGIALFMAGSVGSQSPVTTKGNLTGAEHMGQSLARALLDRLPTIAQTNVVVLGAIGLDLTVPPPQVRLTEGTRLRPWLARQLLPVGQTTYLNALRLNDSVWIGTPCDFSGELALEIKGTFRARNINVEVTSFNGDYVGYIIPSRYYHLDGYEPRVMSFFGPQMPDYMMSFANRLVLALTEGK